jgi:hypothetical protein
MQQHAGTKGVSETSYEIARGKSGCCGFAQDANWRRVKKGRRHLLFFLLVPLKGQEAFASNHLEVQRTWVDFRSGLDNQSAFQRLVAGIKGEVVEPDGYRLPDEPAPYRCVGSALKPALVLPRVSKRLTMGCSAEEKIKHACRLVFLRRVRPHASVALAELVQL